MGIPRLQESFDERRIEGSSDRRSPKNEFKPRQFDRRNRTFYYSRKVYLTDTNAFSNVYFAQYFDFMGEAREELLRYLLSDQISGFMSSNIMLLTLDASLQFKRGCYVFDEIKINIKLDKLTKTRIGLSFEILNETKKQTAAVGKMSIATALNGKPIPLPEILASRTKALFEDGKMPPY